MAEGTQAKRERATYLHNYPSRGGADKVTDAWKLLSRDGWARFKNGYERLSDTSILVVGRPAPVARTIAYPDGSTLILINDGIVQHLENVASILMAGGRFVDDGRVVEEPALPPDAVTDLLKLANEQWVARERLEKVKPLDIPLGRKARIVATETFRAAAVFTVLHEFGHASLGHALDHDPQAREIEADEWANYALFLTAVAAPTQPDYLLGAAFLSIRALGSRERTGKADLHGYPPSTQRFRTLVRVSRRFFSSELVFYLKTTSAFVHDMRMQSAEHALGVDVAFPASLPEQCASLIVSMLQGVAKNQRTLEAAIEEITTALAPLSKSDIQETAQICQRIFTPTSCDASADAICLQVVNLFREIVHHLPQRV